MGRLRTHLRSTAIPLAVGLSLLAGPPVAGAAEATAPAEGGIVVVATDGAAPHDPLVLADLAPSFDVHAASYELRATDGSTTTTVVVEGISLAALLTAAGVDLDAFTYVEIPRADGTSVLVLHDQAVAPPDRSPPVIWQDEQGTHLLRPSANDEDVNVEDLVTPLDGRVIVRLKTGDPLGVRIDATPLRVRPRTAVSFAAVLVGGERPGIEFSWYFDDGGVGADGARVAHSFRRPGTYNVLVNVSEGGRQLDVYDIATIVVAAPRRAHAREGGRDRRGDREPNGGRAGTGSGSGSGAGGGAGIGTGSGGTAAPPTPPAASTPPPASSPPPTPRPRRARKKPDPVPARTPAAEPDFATDTVSGTLLAAADTTPLAGLGSSRAAEPRAAPTRPLHVPMEVWVGLGVLMLVLAGWALEGRKTLPYWRPEES